MRSVGDACCIQTSLHFRTEWELSFGKFHDVLNFMILFSMKCGEPMMGTANVHKMLLKVHNTHLTTAVAHLRSLLNMERATFVWAAFNHLNAKKRHRQEKSKDWGSRHKENKVWHSSQKEREKRNDIFGIGNNSKALECLMRWAKYSQANGVNSLPRKTESARFARRKESSKGKRRVSPRYRGNCYLFS